MLSTCKSDHSYIIFIVVSGNTDIQGPRSKFSSGGAKEECVKENFFRAGGGGGMLVDFYSISQK